MGQDRAGLSSRGGAVRGTLITVVVLAALAGVIYLVMPYLWTSETQIVIRNRTDETVSRVALVLEYEDADVEPSVDHLGDIGPHEERAIRPARRDLVARLTFVSGGRECTHEESVALLPGESYVFDILPGGAVRSGHEYGRGTGE